MTDLSTPDTAAQTRIILDFISALNISRRAVGSYPKGHRSIQTSLERVMDLFGRLMQSREEFTLGVTRDAFICDEIFLNDNIPAHRDYSKVLFLNEIAALTFQEGLEREEVLRFNEILAMKPEEIRKRGGIEQVVAEADIRHILVKTSEFDQFRVIEKNQVKVAEDEDLSDIWGKFVLRLLQGRLIPSAPGIDPGGEIVEPAMLAEVLNGGSSNGPNASETGDGGCSEAVAEYIRAIFGSAQQAGRKAQLDRLSRFLRNLNSDLRTQFLTEICDSVAANKEFAEEVFASFPEEIIRETLDRMNAQKSPLPLFLSRVLQKLGRRFNPTADHGTSAMDTSVMDTSVMDTSVMDEEDADAEFELPENRVLRDDDIEAYVTEDPCSPQDAADADLAEEELEKTLDAPFMDLQLSTIVLEIFTSGVSADKGESLKENLMDSCRYLLGIGDFGGLNELHGRMLEYRGKTSGANAASLQDVLSFFVQPEFIHEVLDGPVIWGKEKYPEIQKLIVSIGEPFIEPLLDHLAQEENLSIRYFYIDCLLRNGEAAREPILARLYDARWYFVRNLVLILRKLGNPSVPPSLRRLLRHPHAKVREEVLKTLLEFKDPDADRMILADLSSKDKAVRLNAAILAENSQSRPILERLLEILKKGDFFGSEMELKKRVAQSLAKIGSPTALPELEKILESSNLLQRGALKQLKVEIIKSLESCPGPAVLALLDRLSHSRDGELASLAALTFKNMRRNHS